MRGGESHKDIQREGGGRLERVREGGGRGGRGGGREKVCERARVEERAYVRLSVCKLACLFMTPFIAAEPDPKDWAKKEIPPDKQPLPSGNRCICLHA